MPATPIRPAAANDLPQILAIYNDVVATSTAIYTTAASTLDERRKWFDARIAAGYPVIVAERDGDVAGFASFGEFRGAWPGYLYSVEHSVHVARDHRGHGVGRALVEALFPLAAALDKHVMIGGIDATNAASVALHESLGFERVAHFREVGRKFGTWLDLVFMQRFIDAAGAVRPE